MNLPEVGQGLALGVGKANFRVAMMDEEGIMGRMSRTATPVTPEAFFGKTASMFLHAAYDEEATWGLLGHRAQFL